MAKAEEFGKKETQQNISMQLVNLPRNLLQRFMSSNNHFFHDEEENGEEEEIELSLGLSLNGRFGVDPRAKNLTRSSSIPDFINNSTRKDANESSSSSSLIPMACCSLVRTCSLPTETEEEWMKRKELQSLRRMEAKRKRSEKQKNLKAVKDRNRWGFGEENREEDKREEAFNGAWVNGGRGPCEGLTTSQGSIGSQGSGSSGISELESQPAQETNKCPEARSPTTTSVQSAAETEQKPIIIPGTIVARESGTLAGVATKNQPCLRPAAAEKKVKEVVRNILEDMPCVSTTGDGPNGKRIEGFLYRYRKGEEVRIVCVCHGSFLSPAEFVKHAGGYDVANPLKHIVVNYVTRTRV